MREALLGCCVGPAEPCLRPKLWLALAPALPRDLTHHLCTLVSLMSVKATPRKNTWETE